jgi:hypothetical protein
MSPQGCHLRDVTSASIAFMWEPSVANVPEGVFALLKREPWPSENDLMTVMTVTGDDCDDCDT